MSSVIAIELNSSKLSAGKKPSLFKWCRCIASLCIVYHFSLVVEFSSEKFLFVLDTVSPGTSRENTVRMLMERLELSIHHFIRVECSSD